MTVHRYVFLQEMEQLLGALRDMCYILSVLWLWARFLSLSLGSTQFLPKEVEVKYILIMFIHEKQETRLCLFLELVLCLKWDLYVLDVK